MIKNGRHAEQQLKAKIICRKSAQKAHLGCIEYRNYTTLYNVHLKNEEGGNFSWKLPNVIYLAMLYLKLFELFDELPSLSVLFNILWLLLFSTLLNQLCRVLPLYS